MEALYLEKSVGCGKRKKPEWFEDNVDKLMFLIKAKNEAHDGTLKPTQQEQNRNLGRSSGEQRTLWMNAKKTGF